MTSPSSTDGAPRVSVLLPVYNGARYLPAAIDSVLAQTFGAFEFLILDDGSTDDTPRILARYAACDPRIRVVTRENRGLTVSLNELIEAAKAPLLARMDADDICLPDRFQKQVAYLDAHPEVDTLGGHALYVDEDDRPIFVPGLPLDHERIDAMNLTGRVALVHPSVMMRATSIRRIGGYDLAYPRAEDLDLWLRLAERGRLANLSDTVLRYRFTSGGVSGGNVNQQAALARQACEAAWMRRGLPAKDYVEGRWRPEQTPASQHDFLLKWGWQAWKAGNLSTSRHFFRQAVRQRPTSMQAWKSLYSVTLGRKARPTKRSSKAKVAGGRTMP